MSSGTLYTTSDVESKRIRAVAAFAGLSVDIKESGENVVKTPTFETKDLTVFGASAIGRYIASLAPNSTLLTSDAKEAALVDQWVSFTDSDIAAPTSFVLQLVKGIVTPYNKPIHTTFTDRLTAALTILEKHLATRTFVTSERISLADITIAAELQAALSTIVDAPLRAKFPNVIRHFETIVNQPQLKDVFGSTSYAEKALQFTPPAKEKKEKKEEAPKPKAEKKPKKEAEDDDDFDDTPAEEPKAKNPLDSLPKSTFNLEDWKRAYSNKDTRGAGGAIEWLYQNYDKEGFSLWRVDFRYNEELKQTFMSSNQIGGFFNRLEASRKYLFSSMGVLRKTDDSIITGTLIARGQDIKPIVEVAPDFESYEYKRLDLDDEDDKNFFETALAWDLEIDGKAWVDGKNFK
ncbi:elongation factor 1-gamma [Amylostereum chailletii]|nr:elongation factor 1-gamma [Amylostereum chailletii]